MNTYLGKSCSLGLLTCVCSSFPFGFEGGMLDLIVLVPDHCFSIFFASRMILARDTCILISDKINSKLWDQ